MVVKDELLKEHSLANTLKIVDFAIASESNFSQLMVCFLRNEYRIAQRAAWAVSHASRKNPLLISSYVKDLVNQLEKKDVHPAVIRNSVRILQQTDIPVEFHGKVINSCFNFIERINTPIAIKAFSLTTLHNLSRIYPEILQELKQVIEDRWDVESPAFKSRARKILASKK